MKPHEETWSAAREEYAGYDCMTDAVVVRTEKGARVCDFTVDNPRARLAAQAPAMARLLLELEWPTCADYGGYCRICQNDRPYPAAKPGDGHAPDCALVAVLRAAGVVE